MNAWRLSIPLLMLGCGGADAAMTRGDIFACRDSSVFAAGAQLRAKGQATGGFEKAKIASGECTSIIKGSVVGIDERKGSLFCVRPSGALDCYWTVSAGIDEYGKPQPSGGAPQQGGQRPRRR